ncbi:low temperature requirement protein A [Micromonospora sp. NPDC048830]|uniref:low temperature requirement protein A n=1 Tax=Micromonospora sp. NPDC048830 TaxID=3364257 RepID=UPI003715F52C
MGKRETSSFGPIHVRTRGGSRADRLEIFFDLVFVFAFFSIARTASTHITGWGLFEALLALMLLWRAWCSHTLVANRVQPGEGGAPVVMFAAMAVVFVFALAIPGAFGARRGEVSEPLLIAGCYAGIRVLHLMLFWISAAGTRLKGRLFRMARPMIVAVALLVCAAILPAYLPDSLRDPTRIALWFAAVGAEYGVYCRSRGSGS